MNSFSVLSLYHYVEYKPVPYITRLHCRAGREPRAINTIEGVRRRIRLTPLPLGGAQAHPGDRYPARGGIVNTNRNTFPHEHRQQ